MSDLLQQTYLVHHSESSLFTGYSRPKAHDDCVLHISLVSFGGDRTSCHKRVFYIDDSGPSTGPYMSKLDSRSVIVTYRYK